jgi:hypothetical protein
VLSTSRSREFVTASLNLFLNPVRQARVSCAPLVQGGCYS